MAKNTKQIALIQHRSGNLSELTNLHESEIGLALDTNSLFIGNPNNPKLKERILSNTFPYGNIQILTEFTDNLAMIKYVYANGDGSTLPIVVTGSTLYPIIPAEKILIIDGQEIVFDKEVDCYEFCNIINSKQLNVRAQVLSNGKIQFVSMNDTLTLQNGEGQENDGVLQIIGINESSYTENATTPNERPLQDVLNDYCSVKNFGVVGDGQTDDSMDFYNAILTVYCANNKPDCLKQMLVPAGEYIINSHPLVLPTGIYLKGEGIDRTIIKSNNPTNGLNFLLTNIDDNFVIADLSTINKYGVNGNISHNIVVEDMTFDISETILDHILVLASTYDVWFRNVKFKGYKSDVNGSTLVNIFKSSGLQDSHHIHFDNCIFENSKNGLYIHNNVNYFSFTNCVFDNIKDNAINIDSYNEDGITSNGTFINNSFSNCSTNTSIVKLSAKTEYITFVNSLFDKEVTETNDVVRFTDLSTKNYISTLDPECDDKKILKFNFYQPKWEYIDYLANPNGEYLIKSNYNSTVFENKETIPTLTNGFILEQGDETTDNNAKFYGSNPLGSNTYGAGYYGHTYLGSNTQSYATWEMNYDYEVNNKIQIPFELGYKIYNCIQKHTSSSTITYENPIYWEYIDYYTPSVALNKSLDLNGNTIRNALTGDNIKFQTTNNNYLVIDDGLNTGKSYAERIATDNDAIPNVDYVNKLASTEDRLAINYQSIQELNTNRIELIYFDKDVYGDFINLKQISLNIRQPYYPIIPMINENAVTWQPNLNFVTGDVIKIDRDFGQGSSTYYYMCIQEHISSESFEDDAGETGKVPMWTDAYLVGKDVNTDMEFNLKDIKYISIIATNEVDSARLLFGRQVVDVTKRDIKSEYYPTWETGVEYNINDKVLYNNRYYICQKEHTSTDISELYKREFWVTMNETGFDYVYTFERHLTKLDPTTYEEINELDNDTTIEYNYAGYKLLLELLDEDGNVIEPFIPLNSLDNKSMIQLSSAGTILLTIDYLRGRNNILVANKE